VSVTGKTRAELRALVVELGHPAYHGDQVFQWIHAKNTADPLAMSNLPKALRSALSEQPREALVLDEVLYASDGTRKLLLRTADNHRIESVLIPMGEWFTQCVSSQVGCRLGCDFCLTAKMGLLRHLGAHEIVDQIHLGATVPLDGQKVRNIVFMGMGEPLDNFEEVVRACQILTDERGLDWSGRRITVSTVGLVPKIPELGGAVPVNLAVSLNASCDEQRAEIMPVNRRYPMAELRQALLDFPLPPRRRITIEYVMLGGFNDTPQDALRLVKFLQGLRVKVNLIPWNPFTGSKWTRPSEPTLRVFQERLVRAGIPASIRYSKGVDIGAACGQLDGLPDAA
jgi:23S rRNA (adenine2503-C2)-methyltransferase